MNKWDSCHSTVPALHVQTPFVQTKLIQKNEEILLTGKAYNNRVITGWLADELQTAVQNRLGDGDADSVVQLLFGCLMLANNYYYRRFIHIIHHRCITQLAAINSNTWCGILLSRFHHDNPDQTLQEQLGAFLRANGKIPEVFVAWNRLEGLQEYLWNMVWRDLTCLCKESELD